MSELKGTTPVSAPISPGKDDRNEWPTHKAKWGQGGLKLCRTIAERDAIPNDRKYQSIAFVETGDSKQSEWYYWSGVYEDGTDGSWIQWHPPISTGGQAININKLNQSIAALQEGQRVLNSNIQKKPDGFVIKDTNAQLLNDITDLDFGVGFTVEDDPLDPSNAIINFESKILIANGQEDSSTTAQVKALEFPDSTITVRDPSGANVGVISLSGQSGGSGISTITVDDGVTNVGGVIELNVRNMVLKDKTLGSVQLTPYMVVGNQGDDTSKINATSLNVLHPLKIESAQGSSGDASTNYGVLTLDHGTFERVHAPGFLAYLNDSEEVIGRPNDNGHHGGAIWFDDVVVSGSAYISSNMNTKSYSIEEADSLDPNITNGTTYITAFRASFAGTAPEDGYIRIYLYETPTDPFGPKGYLKNDLGHPMVVERHYKQGETLDSLEVLGAVTVKGQQSFSCHVVHNFSTESLILTDPVYGTTGLLLQAITPTSSTGIALQQYEIDTRDIIKFAKHYLGADRATLRYLLSKNTSTDSYPAGTYVKLSDGWVGYAISTIVAGVVDGHYAITDNGRDICDFTLGKVFSSEETLLLRNKRVSVVTTLIDKNAGWQVALMKWTGIPDKYDAAFFKSRNNGSPIFVNGWSIVDSVNIPEDVISGDHTVTLDVTIPDDANNYGIVMYPVQAQQPMTLKLADFSVSVKEPFTGIAIKESRKYIEEYKYFSNKYKRFVQDRQGYESLRYTITGDELPAPCGEVKGGLADITIDSAVNVINGSGARGGEGGLLFNADGQATFNTQLRLWSEKSPEVSSTISFWWSKVVGDTFEKINNSEGTFTIVGGTKNVLYSLPEFTVSISSGDILALRMQGDSQDAGFIKCVDNNKPMLDVKVNFYEI